MLHARLMKKGEPPYACPDAKSPKTRHKNAAYNAVCIQQGTKERVCYQPHQGMEKWKIVP